MMEIKYEWSYRKGQHGKGNWYLKVNGDRALVHINQDSDGLWEWSFNLYPTEGKSGRAIDAIEQIEEMLGLKGIRDELPEA